MKKGVYRQLILATACNLPGEHAYDMLEESFIDGFIRRYENDAAMNTKHSVLDALILHVMETFPVGADGSIAYNLGAKCPDIINMLVSKTPSEMLTMLASRQPCTDAIRKFLRASNKVTSMSRQLNSNRIEFIISMFLEMFEERFASGYAYHTFIKFVMHCFSHFFYAGHSRDIWQHIGGPDATKRSFETNMVQERTLSLDRTDDLLIHDLLTNICAANDKMAKHGGHTEDAKGVMYDIYYLLLCKLCADHVDRINRTLNPPPRLRANRDTSLDPLVFVNPKDRSVSRPGAPQNARIATKVRNALELVSVIFDYLRAGKLSTTNIFDLRSQCFYIGRHNPEGTNSVWKNISDNGETNRYLDVQGAAQNYETFNIVLKGVMSAYTLMVELEKRGYSLVDQYDEALFLDHDIVRYIDYLSAVPHIPLMRALQAQPIDKAKYSDRLLDFDGMVYEYAGSSQNDHAHIRENRYHAILYGPLRSTRIKQSSAPATLFEQLRQLARTMNSIPHNYRELARMRYNTPTYVLDNVQYTEIPEDWMKPGLYNNVYFNHYFNNSTETAAAYLYGDGNANSWKYRMDNCSWNLREACFDAFVYMNGIYGVWVPMEDKYLMVFLSTPQPGSPDVCMTSVSEIYNLTVYNKFTCTTWGSVPMPDAPMLAGARKRLGNSIGFSWEIGLSNICGSQLFKKWDKMEPRGEYRSYMLTYIEWIDKSSRIQHSYIDILKALFTEGLYLDLMCKDPRGRKLLKGLEVCDFDNDVLCGVLSQMDNREVVNAVGRGVMTDAPVLQRLDKTVLDYIFERVDANTAGVDLPFLNSMREGKTIAERFILGYLHLYTRLEFLRRLRDGYTLLLGLADSETETFACELDQRFKVTDDLSGFMTSPISYGATVSGMSLSAVRDCITETRQLCMGTFGELIELLGIYVDNCEGSIAKLSDSEISTDDYGDARFEPHGAGFALMADYAECEELRQLREFCSIDRSGFFLHNGVYFKGHHGTSVYYVHRSGRMVCEGPDGFHPVAFDFNKPQDVEMYRSILREGLSSDGH